MIENDKTSYNNDFDEEYIYTKKSIGYADGYGKYTRKSGARKPDGTKEEVIIQKDNGEEQIKSTSPEKMIDYQTDRFRRINGFLDAFEDPTYLIFDMYIEKSESSLFREDVIKSFLNEYYDYIPELKEREGYWEEFVDKLVEIFPTDGAEGGFKKHYIESIGNLNVLMKPIINYPEDNIIISLTEDVSMTLQYLSELYNNLIYSYDTHRYLIPDNLLRFNMRITLRDLRNFRNPNNSNKIDNRDVVNDNVSKFIYILHDCQFNFFNTKNFGDEMKIAGFGAPAINQPANGQLSINFKSYSKITAPLLIDNSKIIDFRERETQSNDNKSDFYKNTANNDYKSSDEIVQLEKMNEQNNNVKYRTTTDINEGELNNIGNLQLPDINTSVRGFFDNIKEEVIQVKDVIIKQIYEEVNQLITEGQNYLDERFGVTLGKSNVYYNSVNEYVNRFSHMFEDFIDDTIDNWKGQKDSVIAKLSKENRYGEDTSDTRIGNENTHYNEKYPNSDDNVITDVHIDGEYNVKYPSDENPEYGDVTNVYDQNVTERTLNDYEPLNEIEYINDVHPDGEYNEKYPDSVEGSNVDVFPDGQYNEKYPEGDVNPDGQYNIKYPEGNVQNEYKYNEKYPEGDVNPDGQYNIRFPNGNVYK